MERKEESLAGGWFEFKKKKKSKFKLTEVSREHNLDAKASLHPEKQLH